MSAYILKRKLAVFSSVIVFQIMSKIVHIHKSEKANIRIQYPVLVKMQKYLGYFCHFTNRCVKNKYRKHEKNKKLAHRTNIIIRASESNYYSHCQNTFNIVGRFVRYIKSKFKNILLAVQMHAG